MCKSITLTRIPYKISPSMMPRPVQIILDKSWFSTKDIIIDSSGMVHDTSYSKIFASQDKYNGKPLLNENAIRLRKEDNEIDAGCKDV